MSEFQYVGFRAVDAPVSETNLEHMQQQSSRARITRYSFENEYHFGDFRGNAPEMLRRGYDLHLHYANFGTRTLMFRLPQGLPDAKACKPYLKAEGVEFVKDKTGPAGILTFDPCFEAGEVEELWDLGEMIERLIPVRAEILQGDLRPWYLGRLAVARDMNNDPEMEEGPVPAGMGKLSAAQKSMAEWLGLSDALIAAVAAKSPPLPTKSETAAWPTAKVGRTVEELEEEAESIDKINRKKASEKAAKDRAKKLADLAADPAATIAETERLATARPRDAYETIGQLLKDLREALAGPTEPVLPKNRLER